MINSITVVNYRGESLTMELRRPEQSGLIVYSIEGLGPVKSSVVITDRVSLDGGLYNFSRAGSRNIVLTLKFLPRTTIEETRRFVYRYFPLYKRISIQINTDKREASTHGYVESNEVEIFSDSCGCVISIMCPDSYLYDSSSQSTIFSSAVPMFEFPFSNESLTEHLIVMTDVLMDSEKSIAYLGEASVGILIHIHANGPATGIEIVDFNTLGTIEINDDRYEAIVGSTIVEGDDIFISTVRGAKYARVIRDDTTYNIIDALGYTPAWFQLNQGENLFAYRALAGLVNLDFIITNQIAYEGI